jgi:predicted phosphodiesterase
MRIAILSDIHSNLAAFSAVLEDIGERGGVDAIWHLGDIVGYGPDPSECIALLRRYDHLAVAGNHDLAALGKIDLSIFNPAAAGAVRWTVSALDEEDRAYLESLPLRQTHEDFTMVHGSPREPVWEYVVSERIAGENMGHFQTGVCVVGHSHAPALYLSDVSGCHSLEWTEAVPLSLIDTPKTRLMVNPGSVGQPRDRDPRASYALIDGKERILRLCRVPYDIGETQRRMTSLDLPAPLIRRLTFGW